MYEINEFNEKESVMKAYFVLFVYFVTRQGAD